MKPQLFGPDRWAPRKPGNLQMWSQTLLQDFCRSHGGLETRFRVKFVISQMGSKYIFRNYSWWEAVWSQWKGTEFGSREIGGRVSTGVCELDGVVMPEFPHLWNGDNHKSLAGWHSLLQEAAAGDFPRGLVNVSFPSPAIGSYAYCCYCRDRLLAVPWTAAHQALLSSTISQSLLKFMFIELVMLSNHLFFCWPLLLLLLIFPSIRVFSNESALCIRWPKDWSFSFSISPSNEYLGWFPLGLTGLISFSSRDSQESSPTPQFKSINSSALSFLYSPILTSIHDSWKNHSFD